MKSSTFRKERGEMVQNSIDYNRRRSYGDPILKYEIVIIGEALVFVPDSICSGLKDRVLWHLRSLCKPIPFTQDSKKYLLPDFDVGLKLLLEDAYYRPESSHKYRPKYATRQTSSGDIPVTGQRSNMGSFTIVPGSEVSFIFDNYSVVFALDMSATMLAQNKWVLPIDILKKTIIDCLKGFIFPCVDGEKECIPINNIYVSVVAYAAELCETWNLIQGYYLNIRALCKLDSIEVGLKDLVEKLHRSITHYENVFCSRLPHIGSSFGIATNPTELENLIQAGLFSLKYMPEKAAKLMVILTDGVGLMPSTSAYDCFLMQLRRQDIPVHCIHIDTEHGESYATSDFTYISQLPLGVIPDLDGLLHTCFATGGTFFNLSSLRHSLSMSSKDNGSGLQGKKSFYENLNGSSCGTLSKFTRFQRKMLVRPSPLNMSNQEDAIFQGDSIMTSTAFDNWKDSSRLLLHGSRESMLSITNINATLANSSRGQVLTYALSNVNIERLIEMRCSEGFTILDLHATNTPTEPYSSTDEKYGGMHITSIARMGGWVRFRLFWKTSIQIIYSLKFTPSLINNEKSTGLGAAAVCIDVIAGAQFIRKCNERLSNSSAQQVNPSNTVISLRSFAKALCEVDKILFQICNISASFLPHISAIDSRSASKYTKLGRMSTLDWHRWFHVVSSEVVLRDDCLVMHHCHVKSDSFLTDHSRTFGECDHRGNGMIDNNVGSLKFAEDLLMPACREWCTSPLGQKGLYLKLFPSMNSLVDKENSKLDIPQSSDCFALLKVCWRGYHLAILHLACFGISTTGRIQLLQELMHVINSQNFSCLSVGFLGPIDSEEGVSEIGKCLSGLKKKFEFQLLRGTGPDTDQHISARLLNKFACTYLLQRSWLWSFAGKTGSEEYKRVLCALAHARQLDGFVIMNMTDSGVLIVKGIDIEMEKEKSVGVHHALVQYRIFTTSTGLLGTEMYMEPQNGFICTGNVTGNLQYWTTTDFFDLLWRYIYAVDLCLFSAFSSFAAIKELCVRSDLGDCCVEKKEECNVNEGGDESSVRVPLSLLHLLVQAEAQEISLPMFHFPSRNHDKGVANQPPLLCATCNYHRNVSTAENAHVSFRDSLHDCNANFKLYGMIREALEKTNTAEVHWQFSFHGTPDTAMYPDTHKPLPLPLFHGKFGSLPDSYVRSGRWFSQHLKSDALLLTFLPAYENWVAMATWNLDSNADEHSRDEWDIRNSPRATFLPEDIIEEDRTRLRSQSLYEDEKDSSKDSYHYNRSAQRSTYVRSNSSANPSDCCDPGDVPSLSIGIFVFLVGPDAFKLETQALGEFHSIRNALLGDERSYGKINLSHTNGSLKVGSTLDEFRNELQALHSFNFSQAAYATLRTGGVLCNADLTSALNVCVEEELKVDMTILRQVKEISMRENFYRDEMIANGPNSNIGNVFEDFFCAVPGSDMFIYCRDNSTFHKIFLEQCENMHEDSDDEYYVGKEDTFLEKFAHIDVGNMQPENDDSNSPPNELFSPKSPLFVRFECRHIVVGGTEESARTLVVSSRRDRSLSDALLAYVPESQPPKEPHKHNFLLPGCSWKGMVMSHLYIILIKFPQEKINSGSMSNCNSSSNLTTATQTKGNQNQSCKLNDLVPMLLIRRLNIFMSAEILISLMHVPVVTESSLQLVCRSMAALQPPDVSKYRIPLRFVLDGSRPHEIQMEFIDHVRTLFIEQLEADDVITFCRHGQIFYVAQDSHCQALGISNIDSVPYWAVFTLSRKEFDDCEEKLPKCVVVPPSNDKALKLEGLGSQYFYISVCIMVHHPRGSALYEQKQELMNHITSRIHAVSCKTNTLLLLNHLHETHCASELLIPAELNSQELTDIRDDDSMFFSSGQFSCQLQYSRRFPLNYRLQASVLPTLDADTLHPFKITNRHHFYVYRESHGAVCYMKINEVASTSSTSDSSFSLEENPKSLLLAVYGMHRVGADITVNLTRLLDGKLAEFSRVMLSGLLARNPQFQLSNADVDFIKGQTDIAGRSADGTGHYCSYVLIPNDIEDIFLYAMYLRQVLCSCELIHVLHLAGPTTIDFRRSPHLERASSLGSCSSARTIKHSPGLQATDFSNVHPAWVPGMRITYPENDATVVSPIFFGTKKREFVEFCAADMTFYYNLSRHMPGSLRTLPFARQIGEGIAIISISPLPSINGTNPWIVPTGFSQIVQPDKALQESIELEEDYIMDGNTRFEIEIHSCGNLNKAQMLLLLKHYFCQAMLDYRIERALMHNKNLYSGLDYSHKNVLLPKLVSALGEMMLSNMSKESYTISHVSLSEFVPLWLMPKLVEEISTELLHIHLSADSKIQTLRGSFESSNVESNLERVCTYYPTKNSSFVVVLGMDFDRLKINDPALRFRHRNRSTPGSISNLPHGDIERDLMLFPSIDLCGVPFTNASENWLQHLRRRGWMMAVELLPTRQRLISYNIHPTFVQKSHEALIRILTSMRFQRFALEGLVHYELCLFDQYPTHCSSLKQNVLVYETSGARAGSTGVFASASEFWLAPMSIRQLVHLPLDSAAHSPPSSSTQDTVRLSSSVQSSFSYQLQQHSSPQKNSPLIGQISLSGREMLLQSHQSSSRNSLGSANAALIAARDRARGVLSTSTGSIKPLSIDILNNLKRHAVLDNINSQYRKEDRHETVGKSKVEHGKVSSSSDREQGSNLSHVLDKTEHVVQFKEQAIRFQKAFKNVPPVRWRHHLKDLRNIPKDMAFRKISVLKSQVEEALKITDCDEIAMDSRCAEWTWAWKQRAQWEKGELDKNPTVRINTISSLENNSSTMKTTSDLQSNAFANSARIAAALKNSRLVYSSVELLIRPEPYEAKTTLPDIDPSGIENLGGNELSFLQKLSRSTFTQSEGGRSRCKSVSGNNSDLSHSPELLKSYQHNRSNSTIISAFNVHQQNVNTDLKPKISSSLRRQLIIPSPANIGLQESDDIDDSSPTVNKTELPRHFSKIYGAFLVEKLKFECVELCSRSAERECSFNENILISSAIFTRAIPFSKSFFILQLKVYAKSHLDRSPVFAQLQLHLADCFLYSQKSFEESFDEIESQRRECCAMNFPTTSTFCWGETQTMKQLLPIVMQDTITSLQLQAHIDDFSIEYIHAELNKALNHPNIMKSESLRLSGKWVTNRLHELMQKGGYTQDNDDFGQISMTAGTLHSFSHFHHQLHLPSHMDNYKRKIDLALVLNLAAESSAEACHFLYFSKKDHLLVGKIMASVLSEVQPSILSEAIEKCTILIGPSKSSLCEDKALEVWILSKRAVQAQNAKNSCLHFRKSPALREVSLQVSRFISNSLEAAMRQCVLDFLQRKCTSILLKWGKFSIDDSDMNPSAEDDTLTKTDLSTFLELSHKKSIKTLNLQRTNILATGLGAEWKKWMQHIVNRDTFSTISLENSTSRSILVGPTQTLLTSSCASDFFIWAAASKQNDACTVSILWNDKIFDMTETNWHIVSGFAYQLLYWAWRDELLPPSWPTFESKLYL